MAEVQERGSTFYQIQFDGSITDHEHYAAIGGGSEDLRAVLRTGWKPAMSLGAALSLGRQALGKAPNGSGTLDERNLEAATLAKLKADGARDWPTAPR